MATDVLGTLLPSVVVPSGDRRRDFVDRLASAEIPSFTARRKRRAERSGTPQDPIVWAKAKGANVEDVDGNLYVDLTAGFAVAAIGHAHPKVLEAIRIQSERLVHGLGDLHPSDVKIALLERLCRLAPWPNAHAALCQSGSEAVEIALKTAVLATGKPGVLAFNNGYHGLAYGPLPACGYSADFRRPFTAQLGNHIEYASFGEDPGPLRNDIGAILFEPIQGRGGVVVPPPEFIATLRKRANDAGALLIADEIFTGLGRCGVDFVSGADADVLCLGKALGGGLPVSACLGRAHVMAAWGDPDGEAIHTGTFYGHPIGCAAALASLDVLEEENLSQRAIALGAVLKDGLRDLGDVRGQGLMVGLTPKGGGSILGLVNALLERGFITLPSGKNAQVLQLVPPITITQEQLRAFIATLRELLLGESNG